MGLKANRDELGPGQNGRSTGSSWTAVRRTTIKTMKKTLIRPMHNFFFNCSSLSRLLPEGSCHLLPRQRLLSISIRNFSLEHFLLICCQFYSITMASLSRCDQSTLPSDNLKQSENFSLEHKVVRWAHILLEQLHSLETKWEDSTGWNWIWLFWLFWF